MEPLIKRSSIWYRVFWGVYGLTPYSQAWLSVYDYLWNRFDRPFLWKDK